MEVANLGDQLQNSRVAHSAPGVGIGQEAGSPKDEPIGVSPIRWLLSESDAYYWSDAFQSQSETNGEELNLVLRATSPGPPLGGQNATLSRNLLKDDACRIRNGKLETSVGARQF